MLKREKTQSRKDIKPKKIMTNAANQKDTLDDLRKELAKKREMRILIEIHDEEIFILELRIAMKKAVETGARVHHPLQHATNHPTKDGTLYSADELSWGISDAELRIKKLKRQVQI